MSAESHAGEHKSDLPVITKTSDSSNLSEQQGKRRNEISALFVHILGAVAFHEMVAPIKESFHGSRESSVGAVMLLLVFVLITIRFTYGNGLHLSNEDLLGSNGKIWLFDFLFIVCESTILIFAGANCNLEADNWPNPTFICLIAALLIVDLLWILCQLLMGRCSSEWKRKEIPWGWFVGNFLLLVLGGVPFLHQEPNSLVIVLGVLIFADVVLFLLYRSIVTSDRKSEDAKKEPKIAWFRNLCSSSQGNSFLKWSWTPLHIIPILAFAARISHSEYLTSYLFLWMLAWAAHLNMIAFVFDVYIIDAARVLRLERLIPEPK